MSKLIARTLAIMIREKMTDYIYTETDLLKKYPYLEETGSWSNKHLVALAKVIGLSQSFVKRLFEYSGHEAPENLSRHNKEKLLQFFGKHSWEELQSQIITRAVGNSTIQSDEKIQIAKQALAEIQKRIEDLREDLE